MQPCKWHSCRMKWLNETKTLIFVLLFVQWFQGNHYRLYLSSLHRCCRSLCRGNSYEIPDISCKYVFTKISSEIFYQYRAIQIKLPVWLLLLNLYNVFFVKQLNNSHNTCFYKSYMFFLWSRLQMVIEMCAKSSEDLRIIDFCSVLLFLKIQSNFRYSK